MSDSKQHEPFEGWVILELLGHRRLAGWLSETTIGGGSFLRIDIPCEPPATQFYAPSAVYAITPTDEATAKVVAKRAVAPILKWELMALAGIETDDVTEDREEADYEYEQGSL